MNPVNSMTTMLQSKKFLAAVVAAVLSFFCMRSGMEMEQIALITGPLFMYIGAQGIADIGKETVDTAEEKK